MGDLKPLGKGLRYVEIDKMGSEFLGMAHQTHRWYWQGWLMAIGLSVCSSFCQAVSDAPLQALGAYIEQSDACSPKLIAWNKEYGRKTREGETSRDFYYRILGFTDWGPCGRQYFRAIFGELRKAWTMYEKGIVSELEFELKEAELINLLFAALADDRRGEKMVQAYERRITARLINLDPPKQFFNCTYFGDEPKCLD